eukprot:CFRG6246T1
MKDIDVHNSVGEIPVTSLEMLAGNSIEERVTSLVRYSDIVIFSKTTCEFCKESKKMLSGLNVSFKVVEVNAIKNGDAVHNAVKRMSKQKTVPIIYIKGELIGGCSDLNRMHASGELLRKLRSLQKHKNIPVSKGHLFGNLDRPWESTAAIHPVFAFPDTLNSNTIRVKAVLIFVTAVCGAVFWDSRGMHWVICGLMADFILSFFFGGAFSLLANLADIVTCRMKPKWVAGPPKQFAALCGIVFSGTATALFFGGNGTKTTDILGAIFCAMLAGASGMEAFLDFCAGCAIFSLMIRLGLIRDAVYKMHICRVDETRLLWEDNHENHHYLEPKIIVKSTASTESYESDSLPLLSPASAVYKQKELDEWKHKFHPVKYVQVTYFLWPLALSTQALAFRTATDVLKSPVWLWEAIAYIAAIVFVVLLCLYAAKTVFYFRKVYKEWTNPLIGPTFGVISLTLAILGYCLNDASKTVAEVFVWIGTCTLFLLTVYFIARWVSVRHDIEHVHHTWMIIPVGNFINGSILVLVNSQYSEVGLALFGIALLMWIALFTITLQKTVVSHNSDDRLRVNIFIWVAAPAAASFSWSVVGGAVGMDSFARLLYMVSAILLCCLCYTVFPYRFSLKGNMENLSMGVHTVAFSFNAVATVGLMYHISINTPVTTWIAFAGLVAGAWLTTLYSLQTVTSILDKRVFRPEFKWGPASAFNRLIHETIRGMSVKLLVLVEDPEACTNPEFLELWSLFKQLHHVHSNQEDVYFFPLMSEFVPNLPQHAEEEHEEHRLALEHIDQLIEGAQTTENDADVHKSSSSSVENISISAETPVAIDGVPHISVKRNKAEPDTDGTTDLPYRDNVRHHYANEDLGKDKSTALHKAMITMMKEFEEHLVWEELNIQPIGRKYVPLELQKKVVREMWESVPASSWRVLVPVIISYMPYHSMRVRWLRGILWAMPERAQQVGLYVYHGVSDTMWISLSMDVPEIIPRIRDGREAMQWNRYY